MSKTEHPMMDDAGLEPYFTAARAETMKPSDALMARILADAADEAEARDRAAAPRRPARPGLIAAIVGALGGWPAIAGMVTATIAGVWFGFAAPEQVNTLAGGLLWSDSAEATAGFDLEDILPGATGLATLLQEEGA